MVRDDDVVTSEISRPSGTVTFLFTDIAGSTELWDQAHGEMSGAVARHDAITREVVEGFGGYVFTTAGDSFAVAFGRARDAVAAVAELQLKLSNEPWPGPTPISVRMGVHVGEAEERDGDYFGTVVNTAARVMGLAHGGQVLVSRAVEEIVRDDLPGDASLVALGEHVLRGLSRFETLFELSLPFIDSEFPPLATSGGGNLPLPATSFVGRADEVMQVAASVGSRRLVTLIGAGGVGKTRLAIEAAAAAAHEFPGGVWFVELAPLSSNDAVFAAVAATMSISVADSGTGPADGSVLGSIVDALAGRRVLLVLDNCEHVLDAAAQLVVAVARGAPTATVVATSREPLRVPGEQLYPVEPLDPSGEGVELFVARAVAADPTFVTEAEEIADISELCRDLDGIPLAIELAAARVRSMTVSELRQRLDDRFRLLRGARRGGAPGRQQTLLATVEWSYELLDPDGRWLFDRLGVFAGGFDLSAVETVCADEAVDQLDVVDILEDLVDRSLVRARRSGRGTRFELLETLRQYSSSRLMQAGQLDVVRSRHLAHYATVAKVGKEWFCGTRLKEGRELLDAEWDNLRAALDHGLAVGDHVAAQSLLNSTFVYAIWRGREEHASWCDRALAAIPTPEPELFGAAAMWLFTLRADFLGAASLARRAIDAAPEPEHPATAVAWNVACQAAWNLDKRDEAWRCDQAAKRAVQELADPFVAAWITAWAYPTMVLDPDNGPHVVEAGRRLVAHLDNDGIDAFLAIMTGSVSFQSGDHLAAMKQWKLAIDLTTQSGTRSGRGAALAHLAARSATIGDEDPTEQFADAIRQLNDQNLHAYLLWVITALADWWARTGRLEYAAHLIGYLDEHNPGGTPNYADLRGAATHAVDGSADWAPGRAAGAAMNREDLLAFCLDRLK